MPQFLKLLLMLVPITGLMGQSLSYKVEADNVYDAAKIIERAQFGNEALLKLFNQFVTTNCRRYKLARLTVSTSETDLGKGINTNLSDIFSNLEAIRQGVGNPEIAQVVCLRGRATARIRTGDGVLHFQLAGNEDARLLRFDGTLFTLIGFRVRPRLPGEAVPTSLAAGDRLWVYASVRALPSRLLAEKFREHLELELKTPTYLIIRTDTFFFEYDGPRFDVFGSVPPVPTSGFLSNPYLVCRPVDSGGLCEELTKP